MEPVDVVYDICRYYVEDLQDVDPGLISKLDGFRRARKISELASCSSHFDWQRHTVDDWRALRQVEAFFKKNALFSEEGKCADAARSSFFEAERACAATNLRLDFFYARRDLLDPDLSSKMNRMERYISSVLGPFDRFCNAIPALVRVTPGATSTSARRDSLPQLKLKMKLFCTKGAESYLSALYRFHGFSRPRLREVTSNRVELVPKNWKTSRTIACEPEGNLPLQLAFDTFAKRRLRLKGIDLSNQEANQEKALESSVTGTHVTVDFKAASDTISFNTIAWLFPCDWFEFLCRTRSPYFRGVFGDGKYAKFSSMGNGATFTIETLVFAAACYAVGSKDFLVYGDDVIIEKEYYESYLRLTRFLGFTINVDKTFADGPFRESCGLDAFRGVDVTPVYIRGIDRRKASLCHLVNSLSRVAVPDGALGRFLRDLVRSEKLPFVPYQESTMSGVWIEPDVARNLGILKHRAFLNRFKCYVPRTRHRTFVDSRGYYLWFLNKNSQVLFAGPWALARHTYVQETSSVPIFDHAYVRKWVVWHMPHDGVPDHLYWWSEYLRSGITRP